MSEPLLKPKLKGNCSVPFGGSFKLDLPERGLVGEGTSFEVLLSEIRKYRKANAIPVGLGFEQEAEEAVCAKYPSECKQVDYRMPQRTKISWKEILQGTQLMIQHKLAGSPIVDDAEAERRARICLSCPWHTTVEWPCSGMCGELKDYVEQIVGSKRTSVDAQLKSCGCCSCWVGIAVYVPLDLQWSVLTEMQRAQFETAKELWHCWKCPTAPKTVS